MLSSQAREGAFISTFFLLFFSLPISFDTRIKAFTNGTLVVKLVTGQRRGDTCAARNKVGDDFVALKVNVVMKAAKIQRKEANDHQVLYGGDLKVDCSPRGLPTSRSPGASRTEPGSTPSCRRTTAAGGPSVTWSSPQRDALLQRGGPGGRRLHVLCGKPGRQGRDARAPRW